MHDHQVGEKIPFQAQFCSKDENYFYVIEKEFVYPDGGVGYGLWSPLLPSGRLMISDCKCHDCIPFVQVREGNGEKYFLDREGGLVKKRLENNKWVRVSG